MNLNLRKILFHWDREKLNNILRFIQSLFKEVNEEIAKLFNNKGLLKATVLMLLSYVTYHFSPESIPYAITVTLFVIVFYVMTILDEDSKIYAVTVIAGGIGLAVIIISGIWFLIVYPLFNWVSMLIN